MKIVFLHVDCEGEYGRWGHSLAQMMIQSCKRAMPDIPVIQLTDQSPEVPGVDSVIRLKADDLNLMPFKMKHLANLEPPFIFLDTDMLITESLESVFDSPFDVAMYWRNKIVSTQTGEKVHMPYNAGFIASKNKDFWRDAYELCKNQEEKFKVWFGDQIAIFDLSKTGKYRILNLPETWNHPPDSPHDLNAKVVHYKGEKRKAWMPMAFNLLKDPVRV